MAHITRIDFLSIHLLLDEMFPARAAEQLRSAGVDAIAVDERADLRALPDAEILEVSSREGRAVATFNYRDFIALDRAAHASGREHGGIVILSPRRFAQSAAALTKTVDALAAFAKERSHMQGVLMWLP